MTRSTRAASQPLWLELPPLSASAPRRLLVFLHGAGSSPEVFAPIAIAWQLKFPGATVAILEALREGAAGCGKDWFDARGVAADRVARVREAGERLLERLAWVQRSVAIDSARTVLVGFSQGATMALELARAHPSPAAIVVSYAGQLARPIEPGTRIAPVIHLLHGEFDSVVPAVHAQRAYRSLRAAGAEVSLDIAAGQAHSIGSTLVAMGTARVMQTLFRGRRPGDGRKASLH